MRWRRVLLVIAAASALSCQEAGCVGGALGGIVGETGDSACDRRYVADGGSNGPFCQEVIDTVAASQFRDDCTTKFQARAIDGKCPREDIIAGCHTLKKNDDNSQVWDWYYNVSGIEEEAGVEAGAIFPYAPQTVADVTKFCADPKRYEDGAELAMP
jgi:hypothetical protein